MRILLTAITIVLLWPGWSAAQPVPFEVGQVWTLKPPAAPTIRVRIGRIDTIGGRRIVSIQVSGIPCGATVCVDSISHMPFFETVLADSVDALQPDTVAYDWDFESGYAEWRSANGGAFTLTPQQAIVMAVDTVAGAGLPSEP